MTTWLPWKKTLERDLDRARDYASWLASWDEKQTAELQLQRLQSVWDDCVANVPYYRNLVIRGNAPDKISSWADFHTIPELTRDIMRDHATEFTRDSQPRDYTRMTGGSTATPIHFGGWKLEDETLRVLKLVLWLQCGYDIDARLFLIWGHSHLLGTGWRRWWNHAQRKAKDRLAGYWRADAYSLWPEQCQKLAKKFVTFCPTGLIGYASALDYFVRTTPEFHKQFRNLGVRFVMPAAEPAPKPDTFALFREVFGCPVVQEFGGVDFGQVGMKIDDQPFKIFPDHNILEAMPLPGEAPETNAALVTTLYRRYTPLIRYRQGDLIHGVRRLTHGHVTEFQSLAGRTNDLVKLTEDRYVHSVAFLHCVHQEKSILNAQLALYDTEIIMRLVTTAEYDSECEKRIRHRLGQLAPELASLRFQLVPDVETSIAGKRRWFVDHRASAA